MKRLFSFFCFTICSLLFCCLSFSELQAGEPKLSNLTCQEYWDHHQEMVKIDAPDSEGRTKRLFEENSKLWNYEFDRFKKKNPSLVNEEQKEADASYFFMMTIYMACEMRPENMDKRVGDRLQETLFLQHTAANQKAHASKNGCSVEMHKANNSKGISEDKQKIQYQCVKAGWSKSFSKSNAQRLPSRCYLYGQSEECFDIQWSKENECAGLYGLCEKNTDGQCSWKKTMRTVACMTGIR